MFPAINGTLCRNFTEQFEACNEDKFITPIQNIVSITLPGKSYWIETGFNLGRFAVMEDFKNVWFISIHLFNKKLIVIKQRHSPNTIRKLHKATVN